MVDLEGSHVDCILKFPGPHLFRFERPKGPGDWFEHRYGSQLDPSWQPPRGVEFGDGFSKWIKVHYEYLYCGRGLRLIGVQYVSSTSTSEVGASTTGRKGCSWQPLPLPSTLADAA